MTEFSRKTRILSAKSMNAKDWISLIGGIAGLISIFWRVAESFIVHISINVSTGSKQTEERTVHYAEVELENSGRVPKKINYCCVIIGPEGSSIFDIASKISSDIGENEKNGMLYLYRARREMPYYTKDKNFAIIPVKHFYKDQKQIGNEKIKSKVIIDTNQLCSVSNFSVYSIVFVDYILIARLRTSSDLLVT
jgi:hypothetical protein